MLAIDKDNFAAEVEQSAAPVILDFWGPQCGPCIALLPEVEKLAVSYYGKVKLCKVNVAENRRLCINLKVMGVPTFLFYKNGECIERLTGDAVNLESIKAGADRLLA